MTKLEKMLQYVSEHNDFYKQRIKDYGITNPLDITQWPILTRKELQENRYNMFSDGYKTKYFNQQLRRQSSSGSTGMPVNVYWDYKDWYASNMCLWRKRWEWYGIKPSDNYVMFTLNAFNITDHDKVYYVMAAKNIIVVNVTLLQNDEQYVNLASIIAEFNPTWLYIQPFVLNKLIQIMKGKNFIRFHALKYIESVGEILPPDLKRRATELFRAPVVNMYGSEEMNAIAYECPNHHMHILNDNVFFELNYTKNCYDGEAIITSLNNFAMPLIRYNQGDRVLLGATDSCDLLDNISNVIKIIKGRTIDTIYVNSTHELSMAAVLEVVAETNNKLNDIISNYDFEYEECTNTLHIKLIIDEKFSKWNINVIVVLKELFCKKISFPLKLNVEVCEVSDVISHKFQKAKLLLK